jgi:hypothetical protein
LRTSAIPRGLGAVATALAAACASGSSGATPGPGLAPTPYGPASAQAPASPPPPASAPHVRVADAVRYGPSATRYLFYRRSHFEQRMAEAQPQSQDLGARVYVAATISGPADSAGYPTIFTVDSIVADSGTAAPVAMNVARGRGLVYSGRLTPRGDFVHSVASDTTIAQSLVQFLGNFREFFPRLPAGGLTLGVAWTDTVDATQRAGGAEVSRRFVNHATVPAWEPHAGVKSLRIEGTFTYRLTGSGQNAGQPFELAGSGEGNTVHFIAADGRYVGGESRDSANLTIRLPVQGVTIPVIQVTRTTVTMLP